MVQRAGHGGHCCGAGHIYGFGDAEERNPDLINAALAASPAGRENNVMLNAAQMRSRPRTLQRLADLGFVLTGHFINDNHGSHVFSFSRADKRHAFDRETLQGLNINWPGMVISETLEGTMPNLPARGKALGDHPANSAVYHRCMEHVDGPVDGPGGRWRVRADATREMQGNNWVYPGLIGTMTAWQRQGMGGREEVSYFTWEYPLPQTWTAGERYRINSPTSRRHNREFVLIRTGWNRDGIRTAVFRDEIGEFEIVQANCVFIPGATEPEAPPIPVMRHTHRQVRVQHEEQPRVVASLYCNVYRRTGRSHLRYEDYASAVAARGHQNVTTDRLEILSDGTERWVEGVTE